jgi:hypothetical protein
LSHIVLKYLQNCWKYYNNKIQESKPVICNNQKQFPDKKEYWAVMCSHADNFKPSYCRFNWIRLHLHFKNCVWLWETSILSTFSFIILVSWFSLSFSEHRDSLLLIANYTSERFGFQQFLEPLSNHNLGCLLNLWWIWGIQWDWMQSRVTVYLFCAQLEWHL